MSERKPVKMDYMIRGTAAGGSLRFFAACTKDTVEFARQAHSLSPIACAALGRLLTAGAMMGYMMKDEQDLLTLKIDCDGPIKGLTVTADCAGHVKGYVKNPDVDLPSKKPGKLNVGDALDLGVLSVIRDVGLKEPYVGQTILQTGEIAEDLTYYFASSEQTPSSVALGVLLTRENTVDAAGGFILQVMPGAEDEAVALLEERLGTVSSVTALLAEGRMPEDIMETLLSGFSPEILDRCPVSFTCGCSREKTEGMLRSLPKRDLREMIDDGEPVEAVCHFCGKKYVFSTEELREMAGEGHA
ncbi:MAG: Hsp33 family molecular chaperone HslO [Lachnospiraceae bacterium]|nr:Hsp33 family molecular chaperone HslO [Lachnospiraceae bacterium]